MVKRRGQSQSLAVFPQRQTKNLFGVRAQGTEYDKPAWADSRPT